MRLRDQWNMACLVLLALTACGGDSDPMTHPATVVLHVQLLDSLRQVPIVATPGTVEWEFNGTPGPDVDVLEGTSGLLTVHSAYYADPKLTLTIPDLTGAGNETYAPMVRILPTGLSLIAAAWEADSTRGALTLSLRHPAGLRSARLDSLYAEFRLCTRILACEQGPTFKVVQPELEPQWNASDTTGSGRVSLGSPMWPTTGRRAPGPYCG